MKSHFASGGLVLGVGVCIAIAAIAARAAETNGLRLVPHPKKVTPGDGTFDLQRPLILEKASGVADFSATIPPPISKTCPCKVVPTPAPSTSRTNV